MVSTIQKRNGGLSPDDANEDVSSESVHHFSNANRSDLVFVHTYRCLMYRSSHLFVITEKNISKESKGTSTSLTLLTLSLTEQCVHLFLFSFGDEKLNEHF